MNDMIMAPADNGGNLTRATPPGDGGQEYLTQEDVNRIIGERLARERSRIAGLQEKAAQAGELAKQLDAAKQRIETAEAELASIPQKVAEQLRKHIVTIHAISDGDAALFLASDAPETLLKQAYRFVEQPQRPSNIVPREGANPRPPITPEDEIRPTLEALFPGNSGRT